MKKVNEEVSMAGKIETISVMDFRKTPGEVFASVGLGKIFVITKNGRPVAVLSKPPGETLTIEVGARGEISYVL